MAKKLTNLQKVRAHKQSLEKASQEVSAIAQRETTILVLLKGQTEFLKDAMVSACHYYSESRINGEFAILTYICEANKEQAIADVQGCINLDQLESLGVELVAIS